MKAVLMHTKEYRLNVTSLSTRPNGIQPEPIFNVENGNEDCVVALITVEEGDDTKRVVPALGEEITKFCNEIGRNKVAIIPFGHLSNKLAPPQTALEILDALAKQLGEKFETVRAHFGSDKEFLLHVAGHPGAVRFRDL